MNNNDNNAVAPAAHGGSGGAGSGSSRSGSVAASSTGSSGGGGSSGGTARVRIRGGGIAITSLLSSDTETDIPSGSAHNQHHPNRQHHHGGDAPSSLGGGGATGRPPSPAPAAPERGSGSISGRDDHSPPPSSSSSAAFRAYQRQDSAASASSAGEFTYSSLGGLRSDGGGGGGVGGGGGSVSRSGTPLSHPPPGSEHFRGDWPGGRPPLVRKRSLTVAMDADVGGPGAVCPSPRGRRRSVDGSLDTKDGKLEQGAPPARLESPLRPPRLLAAPPVSSNGNGSGVSVVGGGGGSGGSGGSGVPQFSSYPSPRGVISGSSGGIGIVSGMGGGSSRDYPSPSPSHERLTVTVGGAAGSMAGGGMMASGGPPGSALIAGGGGGGSGSGSGGGGGGNTMEVEWIPNEISIHPGAMPTSTAATPSPVTSAASAPSGSALGRPPSPFAPSPGREYQRVGGSRGGAAPHSPSPRRAPPSPAQAPGSAGARRNGTRRMSGGRPGVRGRSRVGVGKGGVYPGGGGGGSGEIVAGSSGTYESDYDSDLSELSAYSAMGSLERQLQQDTFFELDEALWRVVTRREVGARGIPSSGSLLPIWPEL